MPQYLGVFRNRVPITVFLKKKTGLVAGTLTWEAGRPVLRDSSGMLSLSKTLVGHLDPSFSYWLAVAVDQEKKGRIVFNQAIKKRKLSGRQSLQNRWRIIQAIRGFFLKSGFTEVDTPVKVSCPGMEPYLDSFPVNGQFLRTSPELHMKRLLAEGFDPIFQMGPCFRAGDRGKLHREEFLMLEWYRAFADLDGVLEDLRDLLSHLAPLAADRSYFENPFEIVTCEQLLERELGLKPRDQRDREPLRASLRRLGISFDESDDWDTLYFLLFLNRIEPHLGQDCPTIVKNYPASQAALAKKAPLSPDVMPYCYRMELYLRGVEIANAFYELTDPREQRDRFQKDRAARAVLGKTVYDIDEAFMDALESGLPPSAGIALGVDRLVLALLGGETLDDLLPF